MACETQVSDHGNGKEILREREKMSEREREKYLFVARQTQAHDQVKGRRDIDIDHERDRESRTD